MWHNNQHSDHCAICGKLLSGNALPFYHAVCRDKLVKAIEDAEDGTIVVIKDQNMDDNDPGAFTVYLVIAFFAGAAVATCAFLLWM